MTDEVFQDVIQKAAASAVAKDRERVERKTGSTSRVLFYGHPLLSPAAAALEEEEQDWPFFAMEEMEKMHAIEAEEMSEFLSKWFATEEEPFTEPFGSSLEKDGCGLLAKI